MFDDRDKATASRSSVRHALDAPERYGACFVLLPPNNRAPTMTLFSLHTPRNYTARPPHNPQWLCAPHEDADDDLDDVLDETGEIANRSNGKSGTDTQAEPDPKPNNQQASTSQS
ncbi:MULTISPECIES: hypothetical protein [unclassified Caballeronia]|uniref:hypothetical protein n=1 Tax=unclassified Caballeronia TaxID=2646786 RepID=UPI002866B903|nr:MULTISPECIES: hypothetical protein [unclassified Caballeronia]MDR5755215.1 hypothetical protein [Caballeronia sp. LZ024]MDR5845339.1 hypothetical protein [Caballeronia sp. LZ031]